MEITAKMVKELREKTGAGMMDCKKALQENDGDIEAAKTWLREKGLAASAKREDRDASSTYGVRLIPTQIFYGADGTELMRHEGFFSKEDILAAWAEHGYDFDEES